METRQKRYYIAPRMEETMLSMETMLALSGGEQTNMGVNTGFEKDASNALANPYRRRGF